jgi:hypothetical protein
MPHPEEFVETALQSGLLAMFVDGLDEVSLQNVTTLTQEIRSLSHAYPKTTWIVTCRDGVYDYWFSEFRELELLPFSQDQIREFIYGWFRDRPATAERCWNQLIKTRRIREVVAVPLLLALFCITYEAHRELPVSEVQFVGDAVDVLLRRFDATREIDRDDMPIHGCVEHANRYRQLASKQKEAILATISASKTLDGIPIWAVRDLSPIIEEFFAKVRHRQNTTPIDAPCVLRAMEAQHGLFVKHGQRHYTFAHNRFREYFYARHVVSDEARITQLTEDLYLDDHWNDIARYVANMTRDPDSFVRTISGKAELEAPVEGVSGRIETLIRFMTHRTPATPVLTRWYGLVFWLVRLSPLAASLDEADSHDRKGLGPCLSLLSDIATACDLKDIDDVPAVSFSPDEAQQVDTGRYQIDPDVFQAARLYQSAVRPKRVGVIKTRNASPWLHVGGRLALLQESLTSEAAKRQLTPRNDPFDSPSIRRTLDSFWGRQESTKITEFGVQLENYFRARLFLLECAEEAETLSHSLYQQLWDKYRTEVQVLHAFVKHGR